MLVIALQKLCVVKQGAEIEPRVRMRVCGISRTLSKWKGLPSSRGDTKSLTANQSRSMQFNADAAMPSFLV